MKVPQIVTWNARLIIIFEPARHFQPKKDALRQALRVSNACTKEKVTPLFTVEGGHLENFQENIAYLLSLHKYKVCNITI